MNCDDDGGDNDGGNDVDWVMVMMMTTLELISYLY